MWNRLSQPVGKSILRMRPVFGCAQLIASLVSDRAGAPVRPAIKCPLAKSSGVIQSSTLMIHSEALHMQMMNASRSGQLAVIEKYYPDGAAFNLDHAAELLHAAAGFGKVGVVHYLAAIKDSMGRQVDINKLNATCRTQALLEAANGLYLETIEALYATGRLAINAQARNGDTALHQAFISLARGQWDLKPQCDRVAKRLIEMGVDPTIKNNDGHEADPVLLKQSAGFRGFYGSIGREKKIDLADIAKLPRIGERRNPMIKFRYGLRS